MNAEQAILVRQTGHVMLAIGPDAFDAFYDELFRLAPDARSLFRTERGVQKLKLMDMIASLIGAAQDIDGYRDTARRLGERHRGYGVEPAHQIFGSRALMACLDQALGSDFTP